MLSTVAVLFAGIKLALLMNYLFTLCWGYILNREHLLGSNLEKISHFNALYFGFGFVIIILALIGFLTQGDYSELMRFGQYPRAYKGPHELHFDLEEYARGVTELIDVIHAEGSTAELAVEWGTGRA